MNQKVTIEMPDGSDMVVVVALSTSEETGKTESPKEAAEGIAKMFGGKLVSYANTSKGVTDFTYVEQDGAPTGE